jgi:hypothetical protein
MASSSWWISAAWVSLSLLLALVADASSVRSWMLVTIVGVIPPLVLLKLWNDVERHTLGHGGRICPVAVRPQQRSIEGTP